MNPGSLRSKYNLHTKTHLLSIFWDFHSYLSESESKSHSVVSDSYLRYLVLKNHYSILSLYLFQLEKLESSIHTHQTYMKLAN